MENSLINEYCSIINPQHLNLFKICMCRRWSHIVLSISNFWSWYSCSHKVVSQFRDGVLWDYRCICVWERSRTLCSYVIVLPLFFPSLFCNVTLILRGLVIWVGSVTSPAFSQCVSLFWLVPVAIPQSPHLVYAHCLASLSLPSELPHHLAISPGSFLQDVIPCSCALLPWPPGFYPQKSPFPFSFPRALVLFLLVPFPFPYYLSS